MTAIIIRIVLFALIGLAIWWGLRRIWRDWTGEFKAIDKAKRQRDLKERARPDVITLKRDKDGTFRPGDDPDKR
jgi:hypothetical protein